MKPLITTLFFASILFSFVSKAQNSNTKEEYIRQAIKDAINGKGHNVNDSLVTDKKTAIAIAEPILFMVYGKGNITSQKPYQCYLVDGYWYISGNLPKKYEVGGVFEIIINAKNAQILKLTHGK